MTFRQDILEQRPEGIQHCLAWGGPLFEAMLDFVAAPAADTWGPVSRHRHEDGTVEYLWAADGAPQPLRSLDDLRRALAAITAPP